MIGINPKDKTLEVFQKGATVTVEMKFCCNDCARRIQEKLFANLVNEYSIRVGDLLVLVEDNRISGVVDTSKARLCIPPEHLPTSLL